MNVRLVWLGLCASLGAGCSEGSAEAPSWSSTDGLKIQSQSRTLRLSHLESWENVDVSGTMDKGMGRLESVSSEPSVGLYGHSFSIKREGDRVIGGALQARLEEGLETDLLDVVITCGSQARVPPLPRIAAELDVSAPAFLDARRERDDALAAVATERFRERSVIRSWLEANRAEILEEHTLGNAIVARVARSSVLQLVELPSVVYVNLATQSAPSPTISLGRTALNTDWMRNSGRDGTHPASLRVGVLDTGARPTHVQFTSGGGGSLGNQLDCRYGNASCANSPVNANYNPKDPYWAHGTATAGVIMGGLSALGANMVGVSKAVLNTYNLDGHAENPVEGTQYIATLRAVNRAVAIGDDIILVETQFAEDQNGALALAVDDAFDSGAAVLATNGNSPDCAQTSCSPAVAHKVLAVGDYDAVTGAETASVSGVTSDARFKPDIRTPTNVTSVASVSPIPGGASTNTGQFPGFNGTSGAGAFSAGFAAILYDFLYQKWQAPPPGYLYAFMSAFGDADQPLLGTGHLRLSSCFSWKIGTRTLNGADSDISVAVSGSSKNFRGAIWWPEDNSETHNEIDLRVLDQNGVQRDQDTTGDGQIRRFVRYNQNLGNGNWTLRIDVVSQPRLPQVVYYATVVECQ